MMMVLLGSSLASEGIFYLLACGRHSLVLGTQNEIVVSWITLWGKNKVYWLYFSLYFWSCCLPQVWAEACLSLQASWERSKFRRTVQTTFGELKVKKRIVVHQTVQSKFGAQTLICPVRNRLYISAMAGVCSSYWVPNDKPTLRVRL